MLTDQEVKELQLQMVTGAPVKVGDVCSVYPLKVKEVGLIGEGKYNEYLSILTVGLDEMRNTLINDYNADENVDAFDVLCENCKLNNELKNIVVEALSTFLKDEVVFLSDYSLFVVGDVQKANFITRDNFKFISNVLKLQNNISTEVKKEKKMSARKRRLLEKRNKGRKILESRGNGGNNIGLSDIVSIMGIFTSDIDRISNYTIYQLYNQYERFMSKVNYDSNFSMMIAGADSKELGLENHWTGALDSETKNKEIKE